MSRIYKGGTSDRSYQGKQRQAYTPLQVANKQQQIQDEGNRLLEDIRTRDRERNRNDETAKLVSEFEDRAEVSELQMIQASELGRFKLLQKIEGFDVANQQLNAKQSLEFQALTSGFKLQNNQLVAKNLLELNQVVDKGIFQNSQLGDKQLLDAKFLGEKLSLEEQKIAEDLALGMEARGLAAQQNLDAAVQRNKEANLRTEQTLAQSETAKGQAAVTALLGFADIALDGAKLWEQEAEKKQKIQDAIDAESQYWATDFQVIDPNGNPNPVVVEEQETAANEVAVETSIATTVPDPVEAESVRQPSADATAARNNRQRTIGEAAGESRSTLSGWYYDPEFKIVMNDGVARSGAELSNAEQLNEWLTKAGAYYIQSVGLGEADKYSLVSQLIPQIKKAQNELRQSNLPGMLQANFSNRQEAALGKARSIIENQGSLQEAWKSISEGFYLSGEFRGDRKAANDAALDALLPWLSDQQLEDMYNVLKVVGPEGPVAGTEFIGDKRYAAVIKAEMDRRSDVNWNDNVRRQRVAKQQVADAGATYTQALIEAGTDPAGVEAATNTYLGVLRELHTPEANLAILEANQRGKAYSPSYFADFRDDIVAGNPPTLELLQQALQAGQINPSEFNNLVNIGGTSIRESNFLEDSVGKERLKALETVVDGAVNTAVKKAAGDQAGDSASVSQLSAGIRADAKVQFLTELGNYISEYEAVNGKKPNSGEINTWANKWAQDFSTERLKDIEFKNGVITNYQPVGTSQSTAQGTVVVQTPNGTYEIATMLSPKGLRANRDSLDITVDTILTQDEIKENVSGIIAGNFSQSLLDKASALGVAPITLLQQQAITQGFGDPVKKARTDSATETRGGPLSSSTSTGPGADLNDPFMNRALNIIGSYESLGRGNYNAVNQGGTDEGRTPLGYSGDITKNPLWGGRQLTDMTLSEIYGFQDRKGLSGADFEAQGGLHAVGRYQFIGSTLRWVADQMGIPLDTKFTPQIQDQMAAWLLTNSSNGIGQWVGPRELATAIERRAIQDARERAQQANRLAMNPNATERQLRRIPTLMEFA